jgi:dTDP-4-dehydrorhamnose 3,5-epimerase
MRLERTPIDDLLVLHKPVRRDERGSFIRLFAEDELSILGLSAKAIHVNSSTSSCAGTLRGIHFQYVPHAETKIVSCVAGSIWDVGVDLRPNSPTRFQWFGTELTAENGVSLVVPEGFGHAFLTLEPNSTVVYAISARYAPDFESGARFDDPLLDIRWPTHPKVISEKDQSWTLLEARVDELNKGFSGFR